MKRSERSVLALVLLLAAAVSWSAQLRLESVLGESGPDGFARADRVRPFVFPDDHGPHEAYRSEWWYLTLNLRNARGEPFGAQFTVFRQALTPAAIDANPWTPAQLYLGHFAVTDVVRGRHVEAERLARGHPDLAGAWADPFAVRVEGWSLEGSYVDSADEHDRGRFETLHLKAAAPGMAATLELAPLKPPVLQGDRGLSAKGPGQASYYYSLTRLAVQGEIVVAGERHQVDGLGWFDREWSTSLLSGEQAGWDWFGLHLDSGEDLMAFQLRRADGARDPYDHGAWVSRDGAATTLAADRFELRPLRYWRDSRGVRWPVEWAITVRIDEGVRELRVVAAIDDQRMDTLLTYWEGLVRVLDEAGLPIGWGYMELTGYE
jgi:predicted secreted hydrolase